MLFALILCNQILGVCSTLERNLTSVECTDSQVVYREMMMGSERLYCLSTPEPTT